MSLPRFPDDKSASLVVGRTRPSRRDIAVFDSSTNGDTTSSHAWQASTGTPGTCIPPAREDFRFSIFRTFAPRYGSIHEAGAARTVNGTCNCLRMTRMGQCSVEFHTLRTPGATPGSATRTGTPRIHASTTPIFPWLSCQVASHLSCRQKLWNNKGSGIRSLRCFHKTAIVPQHVARGGHGDGFWRPPAWR